MRKSSTVSTVSFARGRVDAGLEGIAACAAGYEPFVGDPVGVAPGVLPVATGPLVGEEGASGPADPWLSPPLSDLWEPSDNKCPPIDIALRLRSSCGASVSRRIEANAR